MFRRTRWWWVCRPEPFASWKNVLDLLILLPGLAALLALDLSASAARVAFEAASPARLLAAAREAGAQRRGKTVLRAAVLAQSPLRLRAALDLFLVLARFGLVILLIGVVWNTQPLPLVVAVVLALAAPALFTMEWIVARRASRDPENWAARLAPLAGSLNTIFGPFVSILMAFTGDDEDTPGDPAETMGEELKELVESGQEEGLIEKGEGRMIYSIFELGDTLVREIMVPRIDMLALDVSTPLGGAMDELLRSGHSRVPVYEDTVDHTLGVLYAKDLLRACREGGQVDSLRDLLRPAHFVPEAKKIDDLLAEMQRSRVHMALVVDEYGGIAGLVTLEDIIEEILGEIRDEYDAGEEAPYLRQRDGDVVFLGRVGLDDFNETMGVNLPTDESDTIGGYIYNRLGRVPNAGDQVRLGRLLLTVEQVSGRGIRKVRARLEAPPSGPGSQDASRQTGQDAPRAGQTGQEQVETNG
jgi:CBS domain containing-hemolysin-like protein